jgi:anti-sigma regulatory factor (Ser/Thr protein kinase)
MSERQQALEAVLPASPQYLLPVRQLMAQFAAEAGASSSKLADVLLAVHEACSRVVVHAYQVVGPLHLRAWQESGRLFVEVSDNGTPVADPHVSPVTALGLGIIGQVCDDVDIEGPGEYGTRLEMTFRLDASSASE